MSYNRKKSRIFAILTLAKVLQSGDYPRFGKGDFRLTAFPMPDYVIT